MPITVRLAGSDADIRFIAERFQETIALWEDYEVTPEKIAKQAEAVRKWAGDEKMHVTVAEEDGNRIGFNTLYVMEDYSGRGMGKIIILFVIPEARGRGAAKALKLEGEDWLKARGVTQVMTEIDAKNERMLEINKKAGFRVKSHTFVRDI